MTFIIHQLHRIQHRKMYFILSVTMTILAIVASLYLGTHQSNSSVTALTEIGETSSVSWQLETFAHQPQSPAVSEAKDRGIAASVLGSLTMFLLMQSVLYLFGLAEDRELHYLERIATTPASFFHYLFSHYLVAFLFIMVPALSTLTLLRILPGINIGLSLVQYAVLLTLIITFGISFSMLIHTLVKGEDTANMIGSSLVILTTLLSGSFGAVQSSHPFLQQLGGFLPQKSFVDLAIGIEEGATLLMMRDEVMGITLLTIVFFAFAAFQLKKTYTFRRD